MEQYTQERNYSYGVWVVSIRVAFNFFKSLGVSVACLFQADRDHNTHDKGPYGTNGGQYHLHHHAQTDTALKIGEYSFCIKRIAKCDGHGKRQKKSHCAVFL